MSVECFMITATSRCARWLRRWASTMDDDSRCKSRGFHEAMVRIEDGLVMVDSDGIFRTHPSDWPKDDPRWPRRCACGYTFSDDDPWQLFFEPIYRSDDGREWPLRDAPPGAMYRSEWDEDIWRGPDGLSLTVVLPPGGIADHWEIDGPANNGGRWTRTGMPPKITVSPSILTSRYHGWLRDGVLYSVDEDIPGEIRP